MELKTRNVGWFERRHTPIVRDIIAQEGFPFEICDYGKPICALNTWVPSEDCQESVDRFWDMFMERKRDEDQCLPSTPI